MLILNMLACKMLKQPWTMHTHTHIRNYKHKHGFCSMEVSLQSHDRRNY